MSQFPIQRYLSGGDKLTSSETNELLDYVRGLGNVEASIGHGIGLVDGQPMDLRPTGFWARITGAPTGSKYPWIACTPQDDGTVPSEPGSTVEKGTVAVFPACEVSGATTVAVGSVVWLQPSERGAFLSFTQGGSGSADMTTMSVIKSFACDSVGNQAIVYAPVTTPVRGRIACLVRLNTTFVPVSGRTATVTFGVDTLTGVTGIDGTVAFNVPAGAWSAMLTMTGATLISGANPTTGTAPTTGVTSYSITWTITVP